MPMVEATCAQCGKPFSFYPSARPGVCCSVRCSVLYSPRKPRRGTETPCANCGKPVYANAGQRAKGQGVYCSRECNNLGRSKTPVVKSCANCGKEMRLKPSQAALQFCSRACMGAAKTKRPGDRIHNGRPIRYDAKGYVLVWQPDHPGQSFKGYQLEHRLVMEAKLGRHLEAGEVVHHVNGAKDDNRPENLELMGAHAHAAMSSQAYRDDIESRLAELDAYRSRFGPLKED